jgi:predicted GIY-YIG superfamily endonuclease
LGVGSWNQGGKRSAIDGACIYSIPCECGKIYIGKTGRPLAMQLHEHRQNLKEDLLEKSRLAQHAYEKGHRVD